MRLNDDRGVTLIEILISLGIMGIIIAPLSAALIAFVRNTDATTRRMGENHDVQISAAYFAQDVQAVGVHSWGIAGYPLQQSIELNAPWNTGLFPCGTAATPSKPATPNAIVRFGWDDQTAAGTTAVRIASYVVISDSGEQQLHRLTCTGGSATPTSDVVLAHNIDGTVAAPVCSNPTTCTTATPPQQVQLTLAIRDPRNAGSPLTVTLIGQRRQT